METKVWTVLELIQWTTGFLKQKGIESGRREAEDLLGHVLELDRLKLYLAFEDKPSPAELARFRELVARRGKREPLQHLLGWQPFMGLKINCDARALIPRPETEVLAGLASDSIRELGAPARFADLGTGSGCIALAIASKTEASGIGTDRSEAALALAAENAEALGLQGRLAWQRREFAAGLDGSFDLIVSNPPYIAPADRASLQPEVRDFDPEGALYAPDGGMADLKAILKAAPAALKGGAWLMLECGKGQPEALKAGLSEGWAEVKTAKDQYEVERFLLLRKA